MEIFDADRKRRIEINNLLQKIKYEAGKICSGEKYVYLPIIVIKDGQPTYPINQLRLKEVKDMGAIELVESSLEEMNKALKDTKLKGLIVEGVFVEPIEPRFSQLCREYKKLATGDSSDDLGPESKGKKQGKGRKAPIEKLDIVKPKNGDKFLVVVNDDYQNPIKVDKAKPSWEMLFMVAEEEELEGKNYKASLEYFNTNRRCKLYTQTGCSLTKIFKTEYYIVPMIPIEMIGDKAFKQRQNKAEKSLKNT